MDWGKVEYEALWYTRKTCKSEFELCNVDKELQEHYIRRNQGQGIVKRADVENGKAWLHNVEVLKH